jgi:dipeptidyl-peptidase-3
MLVNYIESFKTGSINAHKESQKNWVADKGPVVEACMGWIETYMDPEHIRAYYEGFVAIVDKDRSKKFGDLVTASEELIPKLPWPKEMEKEKFMAPDFTALEVICFACKSCPAGINIPNYDDVRQNDGFKNLFLNNSVNAKLSGPSSSMKFATEE